MNRIIKTQPHTMSKGPNEIILIGHVYNEENKPVMSSWRGSPNELDKIAVNAGFGLWLIPTKDGILHVKTLFKP